MGLSLNQALNTASMGMQAAESSINVIGNNLSNSNTIGFKSGRADFQDMFSRTYTYGSSSTASYNGGTNPNQIGLGVSLAGVSTDFTQGTVKDGMTKTDMAIQGDGFFVLQPDPDNPVKRYYSRNGVMKQNAAGELISQDGMYVMGYTINDKFELQTNELSKITIPLGEMKIAEATENVVLDGILNAVGLESTQGTVLASDVLTDLSASSPGAQSLSSSVVPRPDVVPGETEASGSESAGNVQDGDYLYRFVFVDSNGVESDYSLPISVSVGEGQSSVQLSGLPGEHEGYAKLRIYRAETPEDPNQAGVFHRVADLDLTGETMEFLDTFSSEQIAESGEILNQDRLNGKYAYYVTYFDAEGNESRPSYMSEVQRVEGGQVLLSDIPTVDPENNPDGWIGRNIYRCAANETDSHYYKVTSIDGMDPEATYIDRTPDEKLSTAWEDILNMAGNGNVLANENTKLVDLGQHLENGRFVPLFETGTLNFTAQKGGAELKTQSLEITESTTIADYLKFLNESLGIRSSSSDGIPADQGTIGECINGGQPGATIIDGAVVILGNAGTKNAIELDNRSLSMDGKAIDMRFGQMQEANGESLSMSLEVYDSLGAPVRVDMTLVLQEKTDTETIYRWYADSADNHPLSGNEIGLGTGILRFGSDGQYIGATNTQITVQRTDEASASPMNFTFDMNMASVSALSTTKPDMSMKSQDGAGAGILVDFSIDAEGIVQGVFSSNVVRPIGQVLLATFINNEGLVKQGDNLFSAGVASGAAKIGVPGTGTTGKIKGNSVELSNTNIGNELIDMILASTMYQANAKIVSTSNTMMDALLRIV